MPGAAGSGDDQPSDKRQSETEPDES
jgi:hypothetical protein